MSGAYVRTPQFFFVLYSYLFGLSPRLFFLLLFFLFVMVQKRHWNVVSEVSLFLCCFRIWLGYLQDFFFVAVLFVRYGVKTTLEGRQWSVLVLLLLNIDGPAMLSVFFFLSHGNVSLKIFYLWESRKKVGENGAELGEGESFAVPNVHRNPSMIVDNKLLVLTLSVFYFFPL